MDGIARWPVAESRIKPLDPPPILSVVIPTFSRDEELRACVESFTDQIVGDLEGRVEIVLSNNAGPEAAQDLARRLSDRHPSVSYVINAENGGGGVQVLTAPWRAQGEWLWIFGDDDLVLPGALAGVINRLERDQPDFLTLNRCVTNNELTELIIPTRNTIPSLAFSSFTDLLSVLGMDQMSFFSSQIYRTRVAREINTDPYRNHPCAYAQIAYYLDGFARRPCGYEAEVYVVHRWQPDDMGKHNYNFYNLGASLPHLLGQVRDRRGLNKDLFETISGAKAVHSLDAPTQTYVDNIVGYLWASLAGGQTIEDTYLDFLRDDAENWRPGRVAALQDICTAQKAIIAARTALDTARAELEPLAASAKVGNSLQRLTLAQAKGRVSDLEAQYNVLMGTIVAQAKAH